VLPLFFFKIELFGATFHDAVYVTETPCLVVCVFVYVDRQMTQNILVAIYLILI